MSASDPEARVQEYAAIEQIDVDTAHPLGYGQDGVVWKTSRSSAVKALERSETYFRELGCYQLLKAKGIHNLEGFAIPRLVKFHSELLIIEMDIVHPPFVVDFGKSHLSKPDYSEEAIQEWYNEHEEMWGDNWDNVWRLVRALRAKGIYYMDPNPRNIRLE
jgi:hypothetical protein